MTSDNDELAGFLGGYFNQDWDLDYPSDRDVVAGLFRDVDSVEPLLPIARALCALIEGPDSEAQLSDRLLYEFGCYFDPSADGLTERAWLQQMSDQFEQEITRRRNTTVPGAKPQ